VPASDGQLLHDLIVEHGYTRALEIGTSTGHSGIWIAWALSKTGGKLITVEIDPARHKEALANFEAAGLSEFIDARLGNAHEIVPALDGPFDFVFSDADKDWYPNYFKAVFPKLTPGGCYATHNISERGRGRGTAGSHEYLELLRSTPGAETSVDERGGGWPSRSGARRDELIATRHTWPAGSRARSQLACPGNSSRGRGPASSSRRLRTASDQPAKISRTTPSSSRSSDMGTVSSSVA